MKIHILLMVAMRICKIDALPPTEKPASAYIEKSGISEEECEEYIDEKYNHFIDQYDLDLNDEYIVSLVKRAIIYEETTTT